jgi:hypothetical protein
MALRRDDGVSQQAMPYRVMPTSPVRSQAWQSFVERTAALFNAAALVSLVVWWVRYKGDPLDYKADEARVLAAIALFGTVGLVGWFSRRLRLAMVFASGVLWTVVGAVTLSYGLSPFPYLVRFLGHDYPATPGGVLFVVVGVASVATSYSRARARRGDARGSGAAAGRAAPM